MAACLPARKGSRGRNRTAAGGQALCDALKHTAALRGGSSSPPTAEERNDKDLPEATWLVNGRAPRQKPTPDWVPRSVSPLFTGLPGLPWDAGSS